MSSESPVDGRLVGPDAPRGRRRGADDEDQAARKVQVRGERVVGKILEATIDELCAKGYAAMSVEDVAKVAGVAKTTTYRRWPDKSDLALDALRSLADEAIAVRDTGTLRGDLLAMLRGFRAFMTSRTGQSLTRMLLGEGLDPGLRDIITRMCAEKEKQPLALVTRALERGELAPGTDPEVVLELLFGAVQHRLMFVHQPCPDRWLAKIVDLVVAGAAATAAPARKKRRPGRRAG